MVVNNPILLFVLCHVDVECVADIGVRSQL